MEKCKVWRDLDSILNEMKYNSKSLELYGNDPKDMFAELSGFVRQDNGQTRWGACIKFKGILNNDIIVKHVKYGVLAAFENTPEEAVKSLREIWEKCKVKQDEHREEVMKVKYPKVGEKFVEIEGPDDVVYVVGVNRVKKTVSFAREPDGRSHLYCHIEHFSDNFKKCEG